MKTARLSIITENQDSYNKAEKLAKLISKTLSTTDQIHIDKYYKFENSFKLDFIVEFDRPENSVKESIEKTDRLCSPWNVKLNRANNEVELIFNKSVDVRYTKVEFNVIAWGNWEIEN